MRLSRYWMTGCMALVLMGVSPVMRAKESERGDRGWIGDNPFIFLDTKRIQSLGWKPRYGIREGVIKTVDYLRDNEWVFEMRD